MCLKFAGVFFPCSTWVDKKSASRFHVLKHGRGFESETKFRWIEHLGDQSHLHVRVADSADIVTLVDPDTDLVVGDQVHVQLRGPLFFDVKGDRVRCGN